MSQSSRIAGSARIAGSVAIATLAIAGVVGCSGNSDETSAGASSALSTVASAPAAPSASSDAAAVPAPVESQNDAAGTEESGAQDSGAQGLDAAGPVVADPTLVPAPESESRCDTATVSTLTAAAETQYGSNIVHPFTLENVQCSGDWARARIPARPEYGNSAMLLFHYTGGGWSAANFGSGFSCTESGTPAADAAAMGCS